MSTLVKRLLTASILIPVVVWLVLFAPNTAFIGVMSIIIVIAGVEWAALSNIQHPISKTLFAILCIAVGASGLFLSADLLPKIMFFMLAFWTLVVLLLLFKPNQVMAIKVPTLVMLVLGVLVISTTWLALYQLRINFNGGEKLLMYLLLLIWIADSGAYFVGRAFGKHKLSPIISPGKSIEGVVGGLVACSIFIYFAAGYIGYSASLSLMLLSLTVAFLSVFGDLFESLLKRRAGVKDSGSILPGHGGILDRIDSLLAAAPFFVACLFLFERLL
ncbi:MAG: phosphatidate cytidylyltransferase [Piscirickettsiaceae bacterium]|nr:MAG: phosphatidate cytidylyltransferase [Piscirickettsiaceae bacterium]